MEDKKTIVNKTSDIMSQCLNINNAYKVKHKELQEVFNAYKKLKQAGKEGCYEGDLEVQLKQISDEMENKIISKKTFQRLLEEQAGIMKEFNKINSEISRLYPDL